MTRSPEEKSRSNSIKVSSDRQLWGQGDRNFLASSATGSATVGLATGLNSWGFLFKAPHFSAPHVRSCFLLGTDCSHAASIWITKPVIPLSAQQNEMDHQSQCE